MDCDDAEHRLMKASEFQVRIDHLQNQHGEIQNAFKQKAKALNDVTRKYEQLKSEKMAAQTMNAASDEAEQMVQHMAGNHFNGRFEGDSADGSGVHVDMRRMHSMQRHPMPGRMASRGFGGREYPLCVTKGLHS